MPEHHEPQPAARDLYEAAETLCAARGTEEEETAWQVLRQRLAEVRAIPGEAEGSAKWRIARVAFDEVVRAAEADAEHHRDAQRFARFIDLPDDMQRLVVSGLSGAFAQFAQVSRKVGSK